MRFIVAAALIAALDSAWIVPSLVLAVAILILLSLRDRDGTYEPTPKTKRPGWELGLGLGLTPFGPLPYASVHRRQTATAIILEPQKPVDT